MNTERYVSLKKSDWYIILALFLLSVIIFVSLAFTRNKKVVSYQIKHYVGNQEYIERIEPDKQTSIVVHGKLGDMILNFDMEKGAKVASSTCPCQVCVNSGWSKYDALVCVPNAVIIIPDRIDSESGNSADAVTR